MKRSKRSPIRVVLGLAVLLIPGAACQKPAAESQPTPQKHADGQAMPPLWRVHIDEVQPTMAAEFERLNIAENRELHAILRKNGQPVESVYEIVTTEAVYMSLRPKDSFTAFDAPSAIPESVSKLLSSAMNGMDGPIHATLKYHHNELWRYSESYSYVPATPGYQHSTPGYIRLVSERVIPGKADRYEELVDLLNQALGKSKYPWGVVAFSSSYGDGAYRYLWQADSKEEFLAAGDRAAVLTKVYGKEDADAILGDWESCIAGSETVDAVPRRDFADLDDSVPWFGLQKRTGSEPGSH